MMKTKHLLLRGLGASVLIALGFARLGERLDPIMSHASSAVSDDAVLRVCADQTYVPPPLPPGDGDEHQNVRVTTVA